MKMRTTVLLHSVILMICLDWINTAGNGPVIEFWRAPVHNEDQGVLTNGLVKDLTSTDLFTILCKIKHVHALYKVTVLRLQWRKTIYENYTDLAILQCVDKDDKDSYEKPFLVNGVSGWRATGMFDSNHIPPVGTQLGIVRQVSTVSTEESGEYRCHLAYAEPSPAYSSAKASVSKTLTVTGSSASSSSVSFLPHVFGHVLCSLCCILLFK